MGNTDALAGIEVIQKGSPPRVWGILEMGAKQLKKEGITPTCVGNTKHITYPVNGI